MNLTKVESSSRPLQKHACKRRKTLRALLSNSRKLFEKSLTKKLYLSHTQQIRIFNHWCSVVVQPQQMFKFNTRQQNEVLHKCSLLTFFQEKSLTKNFTSRIRNRFAFLTTDAPLSFSHNRCSTPTHGSKTKFCTNVLCLLSFKKVSKKRVDKFNSFFVSKSVSRVLSRMVIYLGILSPVSSCGFLRNRTSHSFYVPFTLLQVGFT